MRRTIFALALGVGLLGSQTISIASTLAAETFTKIGGIEGTVNCSTGQVNYATYSGLATGPHMGRFEEQGHITFTGGVVTGWTASFKVFDPATGAIVAQGTKTFSVGGAATCTQDPHVPGRPQTYSGNATATLNYVVTTPFTESGTSVATLIFNNGYSLGDFFTGSFVETFGSTGAGCNTQGNSNGNDDCPQSGNH